MSNNQSANTLNTPTTTVKSDTPTSPNKSSQKSEGFFSTFLNGIGDNWKVILFVIVVIVVGVLVYEFFHSNLGKILSDLLGDLGGLVSWFSNGITSCKTGLDYINPASGCFFPILIIGSIVFLGVGALFLKLKAAYRGTKAAEEVADASTSIGKTPNEYVDEVLKINKDSFDKILNDDKLTDSAKIVAVKDVISKVSLATKTKAINDTGESAADKQAQTTQAKELNDAVDSENTKEVSPEDAESGKEEAKDIPIEPIEA